MARVQRMLDACADLLDEVGYEALTTTLLAERAGVAIGSVYQFFPDKRAVVQALALRNLQTYLDRLTRRLAEGEFAHWWDAVDAGVDEFTQMHRTVAGFRSPHVGDVADPYLPGGAGNRNAVISEQFARLLAARFEGLDAVRLRFALTVAIEAADALVKLAFRADPGGDDRVLIEAKALVRQCLHRHVDG